MFKAVVNQNAIDITNPDKDILTSGSVNVSSIEFAFSDDWNGLLKTVIFQTRKAAMPILLEEGKLTYTMPIPWEVLAYPGEKIRVGAYGTRIDDTDTTENEEIVLPTVWGAIPERVEQGVLIPDPAPGTPTYNAYLAILKALEDLNAGDDGGDASSQSLFTIKNTLIRNISQLDSAPLPCCIHFVNSRLGWWFNDDVVYVSVGSYGGVLTIVTVDNVVTTFDIDDKGYITDIKDSQRLNEEVAWLMEKVSNDNLTGPKGTAFTPEVSESGVLSWSNDGGLENPPSVNIKGPKGAKGSAGTDGANGQDGFSPTVEVTEIEGGHQITITDAEGSQSFNVMDGKNTSQEEGSGDSSGEVYSTEETRIGTWIDGKPLYRRVHTGTAPVSTNNFISFITIENLDELAYAYVRNVTPFANFSAKNYPAKYIEIARFDNEQVVKINVTNSIACGKPFTVSLEYTKTTD